MSIHGFQRFLDNHEYRTTVAVQNLFFEVTVHRALLVEEANKELIAKEVVAWGTKLPSLAETLHDYQQFIEKRDAMARNLLASGGEPSNLSEALLEEEDPCGMAAYRLVSSAEGETALQRMRNVCRSGPAVLFTRPPAEDFIPPHDEVNVVDPPQPPTPLTIAMLRDHRRRNLPNTKMHFGIALGTIMPCPAALSGAAVRGSVHHPDALRDAASKDQEKNEKEKQKQMKKTAKEEKKKHKPKREGEGEDDEKDDIVGPNPEENDVEEASSPPPRRQGHRPISVSDEVELLHTDGSGNVLPLAGTGSSNALEGYCFVGQEVIISSVDHVSENEMHCKPSLVEEHTCFVDSEYIYTFTITITDKDPTRPASPPRAASVAGPTMAGTVRSAMMVRKFAEMMRNTLRASRRFADSVSFGASGGGGVGGSTSAGHYIQSAAKEERDRQVLLKQAIMNRMRQLKVAGAASLVAAARAAEDSSRAEGRGRSTSSLNKQEAHIFNPPPEFSGSMRLHVMGTIESTYNIDQDSLFARYQFLLPEGCTEDSSANIKAGLSPSLVGPNTSQLAWAARIRDEDYVYRTMHTFNQPFELHATLPANSPAPIRLIMSFYSKGSGGDYFQTVEGYAQQTIPMFAGSYNFEVLLWRPKPTAYEYLKSVFIGGTPRLADDADIGIPAHVMDGCASRAGLQTESTGWVRLKINILSHMRPESGADGRFVAAKKM